MHECGWQEAAYRLALDSQVDCMEIDVSRTLDGVLVTLHDRYGGHFVCLQWDYYSCKLHNFFLFKWEELQTKADTCSKYNHVQYQDSRLCVFFSQNYANQG